MRARLRSLGVDKALTRAGVRSGELVRVGRFEFEYRSDDEWDSEIDTEDDGDQVIVVAKIGSSSVTDHEGWIDEAAIEVFVEGLAGPGRRPPGLWP